MKSVKAGDLYFLKSPFVSEEYDTAQEKKLSYLLGTVSSRPAVVIRAPAWWDEFSTVTVLPALSKGNPALILRLEDRYGRITKSDYPIVPHNPHTIPIGRLGKYIGSLEEHELEQLLYAFKWIHDPFMQSDRNTPVPAIYQKTVTCHIPKGSWTSPRDPRADVHLLVKNDGTLQSDTHPDMNGFKVDENACVKIPSHINQVIEKEPTYMNTEEILPDTKPVESNRRTVPTEKAFPPSLYDEDTLHRIAGRFDISSVYYEGKKEKRSPYLLRTHEIVHLQRSLTDKEFDEIMAYYTTMEPFDAYVLGPRLPTQVLAELTGLGVTRAAGLKSLCNYMRDLHPSDIEMRKQQQEEIRKFSTEEATTDKETQVDFKLYLPRVKPYLNPKGISRMPKEISELFLQIPMGVCKRAYTGTQFDQKYADAVKLYKNMEAS